MGDGTETGTRGVVVVGRWIEGDPDPDTLGAITAAASLGGTLTGVHLGESPSSPEVADAVARLVTELGTRAVLMAPGMEAEDAVPRIAARLGPGAIAALDCSRLEASPGGGVQLRRPTYGGAFDAEIELGPGRTLVASVQHPGHESAGSPLPVAEVRTLDPQPGAVRLVRRRELRENLPLNRAHRIVAGGRGLGGPEGFRELAQLAELLGAQLAASRPPCDAGWISGDHQVGITGARVAPELYLAVGISGSVQHRSGMQSSATIVCINSDPDAPMVHHSDLVVVGDWREVVAGMIEALTQPLESLGAFA